MKGSYRLIFLLFSYVVVINASLPKGFGVNFDAAMSNYAQHQKNWAINDPARTLVKELYEKHVIEDLDYQEQPCIPKTIHQIWLGSPLPEKCREYQQTWLKHHPDWEYILWTEKEIKEFGLQNKEMYDASKNYAQKADIARYEILYRLGGLYVDTDFVCLYPFDVFHHCFDFYTGIGYSRKFETYNGLIGSAPGNSILKECIETLNIYHKYHKDPLSNILYTTGPIHLARCFVKKAEFAGRAVAFPVNYFYPWPNSERKNPNNLEKWYRPETFALHYWHASWHPDWRLDKKRRRRKNRRRRRKTRR